MKLARIGVLIGTHGLDGVLRVLPQTENPGLILDGEFLLLAENGQVKRSLPIVSARPHKNAILVAVEGVDDPDAAMALKGLDVVIPDHLLPEPDTDEVFWKDIDGAAVVDENGAAVGTLVDYIETGTADCFRIQAPDGKHLLVSNNEDHVLKIDTAECRIVVHTMGLVSEDV